MRESVAEVREVASDQESRERPDNRGASGSLDQSGAVGSEAGFTKQVVSWQNFDRIMLQLWGLAVVTVDTETTGLRPYHGDEVFSIIINGYYFNFRDGFGAPEITCLSKKHIDKLQAFFVEERTYQFHNAKYDMAMLEEDLGTKVGGHIHCTMTTERIIDSTLDGNRDFNLDATSKRYDCHKDDGVKEHIKKHKLWTKREIPGKTKAVKDLHFDQVPHDIIVPYGLTDVAATAHIARAQMDKIAKMDMAAPDGWPKVLSLYHNECKLLRTVYNMEKRGVKIDIDFCQRAVDYEAERRNSALADFKRLTNHDYKPNSRKLFMEVFAEEKDKWVYGKPTKVKGEVNPKFDKNVLETFDHPASGAIRIINDAKSKMDNYLGFLYHADDNRRLHTSFNQHQTSTGRFSSSNPNVQNMKKSEGDDLDQEFVVRRAIVPEEGHFLGMIDYDQVEYRLMLEYCNARRLISKIRDEGLDVHSATAELAGITRQKAKNGNFAVLFCSGTATLANTINGTVHDAKALMDSINKAAPEIKRFGDQVKAKIMQRGYIFNWMGRRLDYPFTYCPIRKKNSRFEYKGINGLIQGGCADIVKVAMNRCEKFLENHKTKMVMTIHDELVFHGPRGEEHLLHDLKRIMESVYPWKHIPLTAGIEISYKSLADKEKFVA